MLRRVEESAHAHCDELLHREPGPGRLHGVPDLPTPYRHRRRHGDLVHGQRHVQDRPVFTGKAIVPFFIDRFIGTPPGTNFSRFHGFFRKFEDEKLDWLLNTESSDPWVKDDVKESQMEHEVSTEIWYSFCSCFLANISSLAKN